MRAQRHVAVIALVALVAAGCGISRTQVAVAPSGASASSARTSTSAQLPAAAPAPAGGDSTAPQAPPSSTDASPPANQISVLPAADMAALGVFAPAGWRPASRVAQPSGGVPTNGSETLDAAACMSATRCVAVGAVSGAALVNQVLVTGDGGRTWSVPPQVPTPPGSSLRGVACPASSLCIAVGTAGEGANEILRGTHGGSTWAAAGTVPQPAPGAGLRGVACASAALCVAVGGVPGQGGSVGEILRSTDGGVDWSSARLPTPAPGGLRAVACPSAAVCVAVGSSPAAGGGSTETVLRSTDGGRNWVAAETPAPPAGQRPNARLAAVACAATDVCIAAGWESVPGSSTTPLILAGGAAGATWTVSAQSAPHIPGSTGAAAVECVSTTGCLAAWSNGQFGAQTTAALRGSGGGAQWSTVAMPFGLAVTSLACWGTACVGVGDAKGASSSTDDAIRSTDGGRTWSYAAAVAQPGGTAMQPGQQGLAAVDCPTHADCVAVGSDFGVRFGFLVTGPLNEVLRSTDGGQTWQGAPHVAQPGGTNGVHSLRGLACAGTALCVAVGDSGAAAYQNTDNEVLISTDGGDTWLAARTVPQPAGTRGQSLRAVSCPTSQLCVAVGSDTDAAGVPRNEVLRSTDGGQTWTAAAGVPQPGGAGGQRLAAVECSAAGDCVAVGSQVSGAGRRDEILRSADGGRSWVAAGVPAAPEGSTPADQWLRAVSCPNGTTCLAVGSEATSGGQRYQALASRDGGRTWTSETPPAAPGGTTGAALTAVWCSAALRCGAIGTYAASSGQQSAVLVSDGGGSGWKAAESAPTGSGYQSLALTSLFCGANGPCLAAGSYSPGNGQLNEVLSAATLTAGTVRGPAPAPATAPAPPEPGPGGLFWTTPPAPWTAGGKAVELAPGDIAVELQRAGAQVSPQEAVGVLEAGGWHVLPLSPGQRVQWIRPLGSGAFALYSTRTFHSTPLESTFAVYAGGHLTPVPLPVGQIPTSVDALPSGGFAVGTGYRTPCGRYTCPSSACPHGEVVQVAGGMLKTIHPPALPAGSSINGGGLSGAVCAVRLGPVADGVLWMSVNGGGIAGLRLRTDAFLALTPSAAGAQAYATSKYPGPLQILGVGASTVYFSVHRIPGIADAGYWSGLDAVPAGGGTVRTAMPADQGCIQGGAGAPSVLDLIGGRLWVGWSGGWCPLYDGPVGAASLATTVPACAGEFTNTFAFLNDGKVATECRLSGGDQFSVFDGATGAQVATFGLPGPLAAVGVRPEATVGLAAGGGGDLWIRAGTGVQTAFARIDSATGAAVRTIVLPQGTSLVAGVTHDWFVGPAGVAEVTP